METIPKLRPQWKILHEFKPISYESSAAYTTPVSLRVDCKNQKVLEIDFPAPNMRLTTLQCIPHQYAIVCKAPFLGGDWCKVEISHEKEEMEAKYSLTMSVGGQEVGRLASVSPILSNLTDIKIYIGSNHGAFADSQHGNIRGLIVLDNP